MRQKVNVVEKKVNLTVVMDNNLTLFYGSSCKIFVQT